MRQPDEIARIAFLLLGTAVVVGAAAATAMEIRASREGRSRAIALTGGNPDRAPALLTRYGCAGCHTIPGVRRADGMVGPPLAGIADRVYIGGVLTNTPSNLIAWIINPKAADPKTAMPATGISPEEARDVAAYLYTLR